MVFRQFGAFYSRSFASHPWLTLAVANGTLSVVADTLAQSFESANAIAAAKAAAASSPSSSSAAAVGVASATPFDFARSARFLFFGMGMAPLLCEWNKFIEMNFPLHSSASAAGTSGVGLSTAASTSSGASKLAGGAAGLLSSAAAVVTGKGSHDRTPSTMIEMEKLERDKAKGLRTPNGTGASAGGRTLSGIIGRPGGAGAGVSLVALGKRVLVDQGCFAPFGLALFVGFFGIMEGRSIEGIGQKYAEMYLPALLANWKLWPLVQTINFRYMPLRYRVPFTSIVGIFWTLYLSLLTASRANPLGDPLLENSTAAAAKAEMAQFS